MQLRQLDRTLKATEGRMMQRWWKDLTQGARWREELGSIFTAENNQGWSLQPLRFHKIKPAGDNSCRICCTFHHARLGDARFNWLRPQSEAFTVAVAVKLSFPPLLLGQLPFDYSKTKLDNYAFNELEVLIFPPLIIIKATQQLFYCNHLSFGVVFLEHFMGLCSAVWT